MNDARFSSGKPPFLAIITGLILALVIAGCSSNGPTATPAPPNWTRPAGKTANVPPANPAVPNLTGSVAIDGSSTVYPVTEAMAEEFGKVYKNVRVTVGVSGTGGGFTRFCNSETDIVNASRPISATEREKCETADIEYIEVPIAFDGLAILVNPKNTWVDCVTTAELKKIWEPAAQGKVTRWNQVRPTWPDREMHLFGPGTDSGTFDFFTEVINGAAKASRGDFQASEDDNVLVQGISTDVNAFGYFGLAYYTENSSKLKLVSVDDGKPENGAGCVTPSSQTILADTYKPLARPLFIYVNKTAAARPEANAFVDFYLNRENAKAYITEVGYIPLPDTIHAAVTERWTSGATGSAYEGAPAGSTLDQLLR